MDGLGIRSDRDVASSPRELRALWRGAPRSIPRRRSASLDAPHWLGSPQSLDIDAYALSICPRLERADGWDCCPNGPDCPDGAFVGDLYECEAEARADIEEHTKRWARRVLTTHSPASAAQALAREPDSSLRHPIGPFHIVHVEGVVRGYDYRVAGCQIGDAFQQLRHRSGDGLAWRIVRAHRALYGAHAALLAGSTPGGSLFVFRDSCDGLEMESVGKIRGKVRGSGL